MTGSSREGVLSTTCGCNRYPCPCTGCDHDGTFHTPGSTCPGQEDAFDFVVQAFNGKRWAKVRGDGYVRRTRASAERAATLRAALPRRSSSTEGMPHRVVEVPRVH